MARSWLLPAAAAIVLGVWLGPVGYVALATWLVIATGIAGRFDWRMAVVLAVCVGVGIARGATIDTSQLPDGALASTGAELVIVGSARPDVDGDTVRARVEAFDLESGTLGGAGAIVLLKLPAGVTLAAGDRIVVTTWTIESPDVYSPGYGRYLRSLSVTARATVERFDVVSRGPAIRRWFADLRRDVTVELRKALPGDAGALAAGIVTGDDSALSREAEEDFLATGTSHITAVSGSNVAMVIAVWMTMIPAGRARRRLVVQFSVVASIVAYAVLVGLEPPVTRAAIVASLALLAGRTGRRPDVMTLLALSAAILALWSPANVGLASFWLSIVASVAIASRMPVEAGTGVAVSVRALVEGTVVAQIATLPLVLAWFGAISVTSVAANLLLAPLMWLAFPFCFLLAATVMIVPVLSPVVALVPRLVLEIALEVVQVLADVLAPVRLGATGPAVLLAVAVPCLLVVAAFSRDGQRWWPVLVERLHQRPLLTAVSVIAPATGAVLAFLVAIVRW